MSDLPGGADFFGRIPLFREFARLLSTGSGPVNWELARQVAVATAAGTDPTLGTPQLPAPPAPPDPALLPGWNDRLRLAELWVEPVTGLPTSPRGRSVRLLSRPDFAERLLPAVRPLVEPSARRMTEQLGGAGAGQPVELSQVAGQLGGLFYGMQVGSAVGRLATVAVSRFEVGLPGGPVDQTLVVPANVAELKAGTGLPGDEVDLWLAVHEVVQSRLLGGVGWLADYVQGLVDEAARHAAADTGELLGRLQALDIGRPESLTELLEGGGPFGGAEPGPEAAAVLTRLETLLSLTSGYALTISGVALERHGLGALQSIEQAMRARAADDAAPQALLAQLLGANPERVDPGRGAGFCVEVLRATDVTSLERVWAHPDFLPTAAELGTPGAWLERVGIVGGEPLDLDAGLRALLDSADEAPAPDEPTTQRPAADERTNDDPPTDAPGAPPGA